MSSTYDRQGLTTQEVCICIFSHSCSNLVIVLSSPLTTCHDLATLPPSTTLSFCLTLTVPHTLRFPVSPFNLQELWVWGQDWPLSWPLYCSWVLTARSVFPHSCLVLSLNSHLPVPFLTWPMAGRLLPHNFRPAGIISGGTCDWMLGWHCDSQLLKLHARAWTVPCSSSMISPWRHAVQQRQR